MNGNNDQRSEHKGDSVRRMCPSPCKSASPGVSPGVNDGRGGVISDLIATPVGYDYCENKPFPQTNVEQRRKVFAYLKGKIRTAGQRVLALKQSLSVDNLIDAFIKYDLGIYLDNDDVFDYIEAEPELKKYDPDCIEEVIDQLYYRNPQVGSLEIFRIDVDFFLNHPYDSIAQLKLYPELFSVVNAFKCDLDSPGVEFLARKKPQYIYFIKYCEIYPQFRGINLALSALRIFLASYCHPTDIICLRPEWDELTYPDQRRSPEEKSRLLGRYFRSLGLTNYYAPNNLLWGQRELKQYEPCSLFPRDYDLTVPLPVD